MNMYMEEQSKIVDMCREKIRSISAKATQLGIDIGTFERAVKNNLAYVHGLLLADHRNNRLVEITPGEEQSTLSECLREVEIALQHIVSSYDTLITKYIQLFLASKSADSANPL